MTISVKRLVSINPDVISDFVRDFSGQSSTGGGGGGDISCEGATNHIRFNIFDGLWDLYIDGELIISSSGLPAIENAINNYGSNLVSANDRFWDVWNEGVLPHRFELVPQSDPVWEYEPVDSTPAYSESPESISFCLSAGD